MTQADDEGRGVFSLAEIRAKVYAYHPRVTIDEVRAAFQELMDAKLVALYEIDSSLITQLHDWEEHQRVDRPTASKYPPPAASIRIHKTIPDGQLPFDERHPNDREPSRPLVGEGRKDGKERKERRGVEPSTIRPDPSGRDPLLEELNGWPSEWEPIKKVIHNNRILSLYYKWIADMDFWQTQDTYFKREGVQLDILLEGACAQMTKEGYSPQSKRGFRQKLGNLMRVEARIQREKKK